MSATVLGTLNTDTETLHPVFQEPRGGDSPLIQCDEGGNSDVKLQEKDGSTWQVKDVFKG